MGTNALGYSGSYQTWDYATTDFLYLGFNTQSGLCRAPEIRQAITRAIDRTPVVQVDFARHAVAAALPVHPSSPLYNAAQAQTLSYDPGAGRRQSGALRAAGRTVILVANSENTAKAAAAQRSGRPTGRPSACPCVCLCCPMTTMSAPCPPGTSTCIWAR